MKILFYEIGANEQSRPVPDTPAERRLPGICSGFLLFVMILWPCAIHAQNGTGWTITLEASLPGIRDTASVTIGSSTTALPGFDESEIPHSPALPFEYIDLYTVHRKIDPGWENQPLAEGRYLREMQPPLGPAHHTILFYLNTDQSAPVSFSWRRVNIPELDEYDVYIHDVSANASIDMRRQTFYDTDVEAGLRPFQIQFFYKALAIPTETPTPTFSPTPNVTVTPTPTQPPANGWWDLFELASTWKETNYSGRSDRNGDQQIDEQDVFDLIGDWHNP